MSEIWTSGMDTSVSCPIDIGDGPGPENAKERKQRFGRSEVFGGQGHKEKEVHPQIAED
jgi:hypothetical protein